MKFFLSCWFSLSHHHPNHSTKKDKNERDKRRLIQKVLQRVRSVRFFVQEIFEQMFTQIYKVLYEDAVFVSLWGAQIWQPEANKNMSSRFALRKPAVIFWGLINIYVSTHSHARTVQIAKSQRTSHCFQPTTALSAASLTSCHAKA